MRHNLGRVVAAAAVAAAVPHHIRREGEGPLTTVTFREDHRAESPHDHDPPIDRAAD